MSYHTEAEVWSRTDLLPLCGFLEMKHTFRRQRVAIGTGIFTQVGTAFVNWGHRIPHRAGCYRKGCLTTAGFA